MIYKNKWLSVTPEQATHFTKFRKKKHKICTCYMFTPLAFFKLPLPLQTCFVYSGLYLCNFDLAKSPDKDVVRTDRNMSYFQNIEGENLLMVNDILITYSFFNFDLGN